MSELIAMGKHHKESFARATVVKRAAGGVMVGAALTAGISGAIGAATASAAPASPESPACALATMCSGVPTASVIGDSGAGAVTRALVQANAAPGIPGLDPITFINAFAEPILANPLTLVFTGGMIGDGVLPGQNGGFLIGNGAAGVLPGQAGGNGGLFFGSGGNSALGNGGHAG